MYSKTISHPQECNYVSHPCTPADGLYLATGSCSCTDAARRRGSGLGDAVRSPCCVSVHRALDIMSRLNYHTVYLIGLDGNTNSYFYEDTELYPDVAREYAEFRARNKEPAAGTTPHPVAFEMRYKPVFAAFARHNGIRLINMAPNSTLGPYVETKSLQAVVEELQGVQERQTNYHEVAHGVVCGSGHKVEQT